MQQVFMFIQVYVASVVSGLFKLLSPDLGWWHNTTVANSKLNLSDWYRYFVSNSKLIIKSYLKQSYASLLLLFRSAM